MSEQKLFDYFSNQHGLVLVNSELHEITLEVCKSIGIDSLEPAEWIRILKEERVESRVSYWKEKAENSDWRYKELQSENERLKAEINNRLTPFKNLIAMLENGLIKGSIETHEIVQQEINQCKAELAKLKGE